MKNFTHLTSKIKGRIIKEQPYVWLDADNNKEFLVIVYEDGHYSVIGRSNDDLSFCLLHKEDLTDKMKSFLKNMVENKIISNI